MFLTNPVLITHFILLSVYDYYLTILYFLCKIITIVYIISPMEVANFDCIYEVVN